MGHGHVLAADGIPLRFFCFTEQADRVYDISLLSAWVRGGYDMVEGLKLKILELLKEDARRSPELIATMLDASVEEVKRAIDELEKDHVIVKYAAVVNWSKVADDKVTALIEVQITPERGRGFEGIAERIYQYPEVKSVFLMSGAYDLLVEVEGRTLQEVASFVSNKLSPIDAVLSTKTFFILKKYKQDGIIFEEREGDQRLVISP
jgi:DNA-binding Lrp family transcriptional regulator